MKYLFALSVGPLLVMAVYLPADIFTQKKAHMKFNAGIVTSKIAETKLFYTSVLGFGVSFENEFYLLLHAPGKQSEISFLLPNHPSQASLFHKPFNGQGLYCTIEVEDINTIYNDLKKKKIPIQIEMKDEPWGERHFAILDPNGIGLDIVQPLQ